MQVNISSPNIPFILCLLDDPWCGLGLKVVFLPEKIFFSNFLLPFAVHSHKIIWFSYLDFAHQGSFLYKIVVHCKASACSQRVCCGAQLNESIVWNDSAFRQSNLWVLFGPFSFNPFQDIFLVLVHDLYLHLFVSFCLNMLVSLLKGFFKHLKNIGYISRCVRSIVISVDVIFNCLDHKIVILQVRFGLCCVFVTLRDYFIKSLPFLP